jgi:eukaryotic-like serine/threonine-protein kinase
VTPERWQRVKQIFQSAIECPPDERAAFLAQACQDDHKLRSEVESLISSHDQAGDSIEAMAVEAATEMLEDDQARSIIGKQIGHYQVLSHIGRGGMGEVFLAQDTSLRRRVALKLLRIEFTRNEERLRRFQQEARAASALNHPNILTIHEIGQEGSLHFMATEYVEGETLRQHIVSAPMTLGQTLDLAVQVASALAAAHQAGIIHRDIKPENVMLRIDGYVKVLDFGLAKLAETKAVDSALPTVPKVETEPGVVMGTISYMSPEQARGLAVDARTDIWSLGVMIYEMAAGRQPFEGETSSDVMASILQKEPVSLAHFRPEVPGELERIVRKALRKDKEERYQTVKDLLIDLRSLRKELELEAEMERSAPPTSRAMSGQSAAATARSTSSAEYIVTGIKQHKRSAALIGVTIVVVSAVVLYVLTRRNPSTKEALLQNVTFTKLTDQSGPEYFPSLSPDGKSFVYAAYGSGNWDIYLQRVSGKNTINLTKDSSADDTQPAFSPDGERIAFRSEREGGGIFEMGATGESVKRLTDFGNNPAWSPDGKEIACADESIVEPYAVRNPGSRIWVVNVATGERRLVTRENSVQPNWSPHGYRIAYMGRPGALGQRDIWTIPAGGGEPVQVTNDPAMDWNPVWTPDGKYLYFASDRGGSMNLWRVPIEEQTGKVLGPPQAVTTPSPYSGHLSFSGDGRRMVYSHLISSANLQQVGFDPNKETATEQPAWLTQGSRRANTPDLSPDGEWLVFDSQGGPQEDLFVIRRDGTSLRQLTDDSYRDRQPRWSPDGKRIAFFSDRSGGKSEVWIINSDGSGLQQITYTSDVTNNHAWSPDGARLVCRQAGHNPFVIEVGKPWREQSPQLLPTVSDSSDWFPWSWSADGQKIAGFTVRAGAPNGVVVYSFATQQYENLTDFGLLPVWLSDGRRILFQDRGRLYLLDSQSKKVHEVLSVAPNVFGYGVTLSRDDRLIYFSLVTTEADIWMMTLE